MTILKVTFLVDYFSKSCNAYNIIDFIEMYYVKDSKRLCQQ